MARSILAVGVIDLEGAPDLEVYKLGHESGGGVDFPINIDWAVDGHCLWGIGHNGMSGWRIEKTRRRPRRHMVRPYAYLSRFTVWTTNSAANSISFCVLNRPSPKRRLARVCLSLRPIAIST